MFTRVPLSTSKKYTLPSSPPDTTHAPYSGYMQQEKMVILGKGSTTAVTSRVVMVDKVQVNAILYEPISIMR